LAWSASVPPALACNLKEATGGAGSDHKGKKSGRDARAPKQNRLKETDELADTIRGLTVLEDPPEESPGRNGGKCKE